MRAAGTARRRTGREKEALPVTGYGADQPSRPAYSLPVGGWANENPVWVLAFLEDIRAESAWQTNEAVGSGMLRVLQSKAAIPWKRITKNGYEFPWAGWKEVVLENYAVNTALL